MFVHSTFKSLLYANKQTFRHFQSIRNRYRVGTHRDGIVCVTDASAIRRITETILQMSTLRERFSKLPNPNQFHPDDFEVVYKEYVYRIERLLGNEVASKYMDLMKQSSKEGGTLEQLRAAKRKINALIKLAENKDKKNKKKSRKKKK